MTAIEFATTVNQLSVEQQNEFLANLKNVLTEEEYIITAQFLALHGLFNNPEKYEAMKNTVRDMIVDEFYK